MIFVVLATHFTPPPKASAFRYRWVKNWNPEKVKELLYKEGIKTITIYSNRSIVKRFSTDVLKRIEIGDKITIQKWIGQSEEKSTTEESKSLVLIGNKMEGGMNRSFDIL